MAEDRLRTIEDFKDRFPTEEACRQYLFTVRWPEGFLCPRCGGTKGWPTSRGLWVCAGCRYHASVVAGTTFQDSHLSLMKWFLAILYVASHQSGGVNVRELQRKVGLGSYKTAWAITEKVEHLVFSCPCLDRLRGAVEVDVAGWSGVVNGRAIETQILVAAEQDGNRIGLIRAWELSKVSKVSMQRFIAHTIEPGSTVQMRVFKGLRLDDYIRGPQVSRLRTEGRRPLARTHWVAWLLKRCLTRVFRLNGEMSWAETIAIEKHTSNFNRRVLARRGELFERVVQEAVLKRPHQPIGWTELMFVSRPHSRRNRARGT